MKGILTLSILLLAAFVNAQKIPVIGGGQFDKSFYKDVRQEMSYSLRNGGSDNEIGSFVFETRMKENRLHVYTSLRLFNSTDTWIDTSIADSQTFQPVYRSSSTPAGEMVLNYEKEITGFYYDRKTKKKTAIREPGQSIFFDSYAYPYLLGLLPLTSGYKSEIAIYDYKQGSERNIKKCRIEEVKSNVFVSSLTGEHKTWQVDVLEEASNDRYIYYFDKDSRRLWKIEIFSRGQHIMLADRESDYNPFTAGFDKEETLKLIKSGTATITGKVFARDNQNSGMLKGMAVLNVNKKQYARKGTSILLIPYTAYFKEWVKLNESLRKKGQAIPLSKEAAGCIKVATVYDDKGTFEFTNLMPGDYLLYTEFGYTHTAHTTEVVGYTDTYINGLFLGSSPNTVTYQYNTNAAANVKKVVTIKKEKEKLEVKLKKTL